jgi:small subunit ribosomal protein S14
LAKKSLRVKQQKQPKFGVRRYNRCSSCGRARAYYRKFGICRICFRNMALDGKIPGVVKASW